MPVGHIETAEEIDPNGWGAPASGFLVMPDGRIWDSAAGKMTDKRVGSNYAGQWFPTLEELANTYGPGEFKDTELTDESNQDSYDWLGLLGGAATGIGLGTAMGGGDSGGGGGGSVQPPSALPPIETAPPQSPPATNQPPDDPGVQIGSRPDSPNGLRNDYLLPIITGLGGLGAIGGPETAPPPPPPPNPNPDPPTTNGPDTMPPTNNSLTDWATLLAGLGITAWGSLGGPNTSNPTTPTPRDLGGELGTIGSNAGGLLSLITGGNPDFTNSSLSGLNAFGGGVGPLGNALNTANRTSGLNDVTSMGGQYNQIIHDANRPYYDQLNSYTSNANAPIATNASFNQAQGIASQGFGTFNPQGLFASTNQGSQTVGAGQVDPMMVGQQGVNPLLSQLTGQAMQNQGPSALQQGQNFYGMQALMNGGNLSQSELRDVQQSSRAGFAARGLGATNASIVDEAFQTDAAKRQRLLQNLGIAQTAQNQGLAEQNQQQQFGLGVGSQLYGYGQLAQQAGLANQGANLSGQLANQSTGLSAAQSNQSAALQAQQQALQGQIANQGFGLNSYNANVNSQLAQQQALQQSATFLEAQRQAQLQAQALAAQLQAGGRTDPYSAIIGGTNDQLGATTGFFGQNQNNQTSLLNALLGYGNDVNNTNTNAAASASIAGTNQRNALNGTLIAGGLNLLGTYLGNRGGT